MKRRSFLTGALGAGMAYRLGRQTSLTPSAPTSQPTNALIVADVTAGEDIFG